LRAHQRELEEELIADGTSAALDGTVVDRRELDRLSASTDDRIER
jgi:hypothetical protein